MSKFHSFFSTLKLSIIALIKPLSLILKKFFRFMLTSEFFIALMSLVVSACSLYVANIQTELSALSLYPHFEIGCQGIDTNNDQVNDVSAITINNRGGNFYSFDCETVSFVTVNDFRDTKEKKYYIPIDSMFGAGYRSNTPPLVFEKHGNLHLYTASSTQKLMTENCNYSGISTFMKITYQNVKLETIVEYYNPYTGYRLSPKEGAYYFEKHKWPSSIDDSSYFDYRPSAEASIDIILNRIDSILTSDKEAASLLLIPQYQK